MSTIFLTANDTFTLLGTNTNDSINGRSGGTETVILQGNPTGTVLDGNIETVQVAGTASNTTLQVNATTGRLELSSGGVVYASFSGGLNQAVDLQFTDGNVRVTQTGANSFTIANPTNANDSAVISPTSPQLGSAVSRGSETSTAGDGGAGGGQPTLPTVSLAPTNGQTTEGDSGTKVVTFTVTLSNASNDEVSVNYATAGSSAKSEIDFLSSSGTLVFAPGTTEQTFDVRIIGDRKGEPNETFRVELSNPQNALLDQSGGAFEALHTIIDNGDPGGFVYDQTLSFNSQTGALIFVSALERFPVPDFDGDGIFELGDSGVTTTYVGTTQLNGGTYPVFVPFNPNSSAVPQYNVYYDGPYIDPDSANFTFGTLTAEPFIFG